MRLCFLDSCSWDYDLDTPYASPLGGSQSALCYLAENLAAAGVAVTLLNNGGRAGVSRGVTVRRLNATPIQDLASFDAVIVLNDTSPERIRQIRRGAGARTRLLLWLTHAADQPAVGGLGQPGFVDLLDGFLFVSRWQAQRYLEAFPLPAAKAIVLRNAIAPAFQDMFAPAEAILPAKAPVLTYTSTPFRGLELLVPMMPAVRHRHPATTLEVYSSLQVYRVDGARDHYGWLYDACRAMPGVDYVGSVPQPDLARRLRRASVLAYPSTFAETSCIAVLEAMAAGCLVITADLGALPETCAGFAHLVPSDSDRDAFAQRFSADLVRLLNTLVLQPDQVEEHLRRQIAHINATATWAIRAREFADWLRGSMG